MTVDQRNELTRLYMYSAIWRSLKFSKGTNKKFVYTYIVGARSAEPPRGIQRPPRPPPSHRQKGWLIITINNTQNNLRTYKKWKHLELTTHILITVIIE